MGQEEEKKERLKAFEGYQITMQVIEIWGFVDASTVCTDNNQQEQSLSLEFFLVSGLFF